MNRREEIVIKALATASLLLRTDEGSRRLFFAYLSVKTAPDHESRTHHASREWRLWLLGSSPLSKEPPDAD